MSRVKRAILIAAGIGKRLRPVTLKTPKPLISVNGKVIIQNSIDMLFANGIEDIYIVVGYKKEQFFDAFSSDPRIHIIENQHYTEGNNITSIYPVREYLPESFVLEGDILINDSSILNPEMTESVYFASWKAPETEWSFKVRNGCIEKCNKSGRETEYRMWGISMWTKDDGKRLSELIEREYNQGNWDIYWDELALFTYKDQFRLGIREISNGVLMEIDTFDELKEIDRLYEKYD